MLGPVLRLAELLFLLVAVELDLGQLLAELPDLLGLSYLGGLLARLDDISDRKVAGIGIRIGILHRKAVEEAVDIGAVGLLLGTGVFGIVGGGDIGLAEEFVVLLDGAEHQ